MSSRSSGRNSSIDHPSLDRTNPVVKWSGTVTVGGKPIPTDLPEAFILVRPANPDQHGMAGPTQGVVNPDGTYQLKDVPRGKVIFQFRLMQNVLAQIRKHGNSGKHLSGGERSMLSGFQEAA